MTRVFFQCDNPKQVSLLGNEFDNAMHITVSDSSDSNTPDEDGGLGDTEDFEIVDCHFKEVTVSLFLCFFFVCWFLKWF